MSSLHLPALLVVVPLLSAPLCAILPGRLSWLVAVVVSLATLAITWVVHDRVLAEGVISYMIGNWPSPLGIEYRIDEANAFVLLLVAGIGAVVALWGRQSVVVEVGRRQERWYWTMYLLALAGLLGVTITGDAFNVFVFLEISSLASYVLIGFGRDRRALTAAYQYLIMGTIGATFFVIGVGLLYAMTGTLNMADLAVRLPLVEQMRPVHAAFAFLAVGISLKLALFPLHLWLPNAYAFAPSTTTTFLAATATKVAIYLFLRFFFSIFGGAEFFDKLPLAPVLIALSVAAILVASTVAVFQHNVKRMLAYSSVAQIGYITLGVGIASQTALTGAIVHLFNHALMKGALFVLVGGIAIRGGAATIAGMAGLGRRMPWTMAGFVIAGLSMVGAPGTVGFISKWYLALGAIEAGWWWLAAIIVAGSLFPVVYLGRVVETAYFRVPTEATNGLREPPADMLGFALLLVVACVWFG
ncbi:MAG: monovalent cation/H+ antiporter subunit D family protein, partial [Alphaproteobacteria bacterium]|nr:monovalent cation/H+ antiporter subunit D family protein [Alphaproteobacteria bacterium]